MVAAAAAEAAAAVLSTSDLIAAALDCNMATTPREPLRPTGAPPTNPAATPPLPPLLPPPVEEMEDDRDLVVPLAPAASGDGEPAAAALAVVGLGGTTPPADGGVPAAGAAGVGADAALAAPSGSAVTDLRDPNAVAGTAPGAAEGVGGLLQEADPARAGAGADVEGEAAAAGDAPPAAAPPGLPAGLAPH